MEILYDNRVWERLKIAFWILEFLELLLCIIILGITGSAAEGMKNDLRLPNIPGKLGYNIAIASLTMLSLLVLFLLDVFRTSRSTTWYRWNNWNRPWVRVSLNILFIALWIGCVASSFYTCSDLCSAAGGIYSWIRYATLCCDCSIDAITTSCYNELSSSASQTVEQRTGRYEATQALDILLVVVLIASTFVLGAFQWVKEYDDPNRPPTPVTDTVEI